MDNDYLKYSPTYNKTNYIAGGVHLIGNVTLGLNSSVWFNSVLRGDENKITIGENSNIQDLVTIHTDPGSPTTIGDYVTVGHNAVIHGCTISDNCIIGMHATILNDAKIGKNCIIGANALVTENKVIPDNSLVLGSPGKVIRQLSNEEITKVRENALHYVKLAKSYLKHPTIIQLKEKI